MSIIQATHLVKQFHEITALADLSLTINEGEVFGCLGPNGAGKTTLIRLLNGLLEPTQGNITVFGMNPLLDGAEVRRRAGVLTEEVALYEQLSAEENLLFHGKLFGIPQHELSQRVDAILTVFALQDRKRERVGAFSKGMKQRLALARALLHDPEILYLDEPTASLDPEAAEQVIELVGALSREKARTVFLATHNLEEAERLCQRIMILNKGQVLALGTKAVLLNEAADAITIQGSFFEVPSSELIQKIMHLNGVHTVTYSGKKFECSVSNESVISSLITCIIENHGKLRSIFPEERSLRDVYLQLQQNHRIKESPAPGASE